MFGRVNVWRIAELKVVGKKNLGEWIDFGYKETTYKLIRSTDNSPNFRAAIHSHYMVCKKPVSTLNFFIVNSGTNFIRIPT